MIDDLSKLKYKSISKASFLELFIFLIKLSNAYLMTVAISKYITKRKYVVCAVQYLQFCTIF